LISSRFWQYSFKTSLTESWLYLQQSWNFLLMKWVSLF
jgi:hypothetical protein